MEKMDVTIEMRDALSQPVRLRFEAIETVRDLFVLR